MRPVNCYMIIQTLMNVHHLHVVIPVPTLWVVLCALVMMDMYWIVIDCPALVSKLSWYLDVFNNVFAFPKYRTSYCDAAESHCSIH